MKSHLLLIALLFCKIIATSQNFQWAKRVGAKGNDEGFSIALDGFGHVYTTGLFTGTVDLDPGPGIYNLTSAGFDDIFILKLDASGNFIWAKRMGGKQRDWPWSICTDVKGNVYITGYYADTADFDPGPETYRMTSVALNDIFISKLDPSGNFIWAKSMGGSHYEEGRSIIVDESQNVYTTGSFIKTVDFDPGPGIYNLTVAGSTVYSDVFISKLDSSGNFVWAKNVGGTFYNKGTSIAVDKLGYVYTGGNFIGTVDFDPSIGVFNLTGNFQSSFILKLDQTGNFVWAAGFSGTGTAIESPTSLVLDNFNNIITSGIFNGTQDFDPGLGTYNMTASAGYDVFVLKLDTSGKFKWVVRIGGMGMTIHSSIKVDGTGNIYTAGFFRDSVDFNPGIDLFYLATNGNNDVFVSKIDSTGKFVWAKKFGGTNNDYSNSITVDDLGNVYTTGRFVGSADFDPDSGIFNLSCLDTTQYCDAFISKLSIYMTGISESFNPLTISIFPNPVRNRIYINVAEKYSGSGFIIYDVAGKEVFQGKLNSVGTDIDLNYLSNGYYLLYIEGIGGKYVKLLKQ